MDWSINTILSESESEEEDKHSEGKGALTQLPVPCGGSTLCIGQTSRSSTPPAPMHCCSSVAGRLNSHGNSSSGATAWVG